MIDAVLERSNMDLAWEQIRAKKGGPGIDEVTLSRWGRNWEANIERLRHQVRTNTYHPNRPKRFKVRKKGGGQREVCRLTVSDKVLQRAVLNVIDDCFERQFLDCSHGYRRKRSVATAIEQVLRYRDKGLHWVLDADIQACFDSLDHDILIGLVRSTIDDWFIINLTRLWLQAGRKHRRRGVGIPLGAVLSPLWANIYLHQLDIALAEPGFKEIRYADDFLVMAEDESGVQHAYRAVQEALQRVNLCLAPHKTRMASFEDGFQFLGVAFYHDTYSYLWREKRIKVKGKVLRMLYQHPPDFY